ncbi:MAG: NUDIX domain-containing protein [Polyangiaceae bacterium]|nr:NUDIX domain-containing protein [Polyangiaceae bacterium]
MPKRSAGVLLYRGHGAALEVLLVHPGGPFWANRDDGAWTIPKGELLENEPLLTGAQREFLEETGHTVSGTFTPLGSVRLKSGKIVYAFCVEGDLDPATVRSNLFEAEWPPRSGKIRKFPEVDRAGFFGLEAARVKLHPGQLPFLERLLSHLL